MRTVFRSVLFISALAVFAPPAARHASACIRMEGQIVDGDPTPTRVFSFGPADVGTEFMFDIYIEDLPPLYAWSCLLYTADSSSVTDEGFDFVSPAGWTEEFFTTPPWLPPEPDGPPYGRRYYIRDTDFTVSTPLEIPATVGTFHFQCAAEGIITFKIDLVQSGYLTTGLNSGDFNGPDAGCPTIGARQESWGSVKKLFR